ncbi:MAG: hypothetical protein ACREOZ_00345 [Gloeomargaritales cyanobacterium]
MADLRAAASARKHAVIESTSKEQARAWGRWKQWLSGIGQQDDVFLDEFNMHKKHLLLGGFAAAVREGRFSSTRHTLLGESTVRSTVDHIAQTYRAHHRRDPRHDEEGRVAFVLQRQFKG